MAWFRLADFFLHSGKGFATSAGQVPAGRISEVVLKPVRNETFDPSEMRGHHPSWYHATRVKGRNA